MAQSVAPQAAAVECRTQSDKDEPPASLRGARSPAPAMRLLDSDISDTRALVIDANPTSRTVLVSMLRDFGVGEVAQSSRVHDARRVLESRVFDIVLCESHFHGSHMTGQDLLDDLRRAQLLPFSTVFVMVTAEASYAKVAEAAENALDSYLLKPHNADTLGERLRHARERKRVLSSIFMAIEANDFASAAELCLDRFRQRGKFWLYAARIGAELLLRLQRHTEAKALFEAIYAAQALPWAKLGVARAQIEAGAAVEGKRVLESLIAAQPSFADAYDILGRTQIEHGDFDGAYRTYAKAVDITPASLTRLQKKGMTAFFVGEAAEATTALHRACMLGNGSKLLDYQSLFLLGVLRYDSGDLKALVRCHEDLEKAREKQPQSARVRRLYQTLEVCRALLERRVPDVVATVRALADERRREDFDYEAAGNLLIVLARLQHSEIQLEDASLWIRDIARRYCASRTATELLCRSVAMVPEVEQQVRGIHADIEKQAEQAMSLTVAGQVAAAVKTLLVQGNQSLNAKLIDLAWLLVTKHRDKLPDAEVQSQILAKLRERYCISGVQIGRREKRAAGGLALREAAPVKPAAAPQPSAAGVQKEKQPA